jgi:hypothetical protein
MNIATLTWFVIGACIVYAIAVDPYVYPWLVLQFKRLELALERTWFMIRFNPDTPWVRYGIKRNADRMARKIMKENENR